MSGTQVGTIFYDVRISTDNLKNDLKNVEKAIDNSSAKTTATTKKQSAQITDSVQKQVQATKDAAANSYNEISKYSPQIQSKFLSVERATNAVAAASDRNATSLAKYGQGSTQAIRSTSQLEMAVKNQALAQGRLDQALDNTTNKTSKFGQMSATAFGIIAGVAATIANKAINSITNSIESAVARVDTLKNAAKTFEYMGFSAKDSADATKALTTSILGLPTPLDGAMRGMTALAATYGDVKVGQKVFTALNDAILGFGGSADMVNNAIMQVSQMPMDGPLDAQTWMSLRNSGLTPVLVAMSKDMGMSVGAMKEAFGSGQLKVKDFTDELMKMDTQGGGGLVSLQQIAKNATSGIGTGFANMQTSIVRGMADIINTIGQKNISTAISNIGSAFESALKSISNGIKFIIANKNIFVPLTAGIGATVAALILYNTYLKVSTALTVAYGVVSRGLSLIMALQAQGLGIVRAAWLALNIAMNANPVGLIIALVVGLGVGLATLSGMTNQSKNTTTGLAAAQRDLKAAMDASKKAIDDNANAQYQYDLAQQTVLQDQKDINQALIDYGPNSLEYRTAIDKEKMDTGYLADAKQRVVDTGNAIVDTNKKVVEQKDVVAAALAQTGNAAWNAAGGFGAMAAAAQTASDNAIKAGKSGINASTDVWVTNNGQFGGPKFATGGYTGSGGVNDVAGIVHKGEYVLPQEQVNQSTGKPKASSTGNTTINNYINMSGIMTSSKADERAIAQRMGQRLNEVLKAKGRPALI